MTKGKSYQRYSAEFKLMALRKASEDAVTANSVCEELGISLTLLIVIAKFLVN
jgi:transposase